MLLDDAFYAFGKQHPGFAGIIAQDDRTLVARFTGKPTATEDEVRAFAIEALGQPAGNMRITFGSATYDWVTMFDGLRRVVESVERESPDAIQSFDIDELQNVVRVGVSADASIERLNARFPSERWLSFEEAVRVETTQGTRALYRPVLGGTQIVSGFRPACSNAGAASTTYFDDPSWWMQPFYVLTAAHCSNNWGDVSGESMYQPQWPDSVGYEELDPPFKTRAQLNDWRCPLLQLCRYSDVSVYRLTGSGVPAYPYPVVAATPNADPLTVSYGWTMVGQWVNPPAGLFVVKTGRSTGSTAGTITQTCQTSLVTGPFNDRVFICFSAASAGIEPGDSGGAIVGGGTGVLNNHAGVVFARGGPTTTIFATFGSIAADFFPLALVTFCQNGPC